MESKSVDIPDLKVFMVEDEIKRFVETHENLEEVKKTSVI